MPGTNDDKKNNNGKEKIKSTEKERKEEHDHDLTHLLSSNKNNNNKACETRSETLSKLQQLLNKCHRPSPCNVYGRGPLFISDIPKQFLPQPKTNNKKEGSHRPSSLCVNMGIDEAGRGPILGPMVYASVFWSADSNDDDSSSSSVPIKGLNDSKVLSKTDRSSLFAQLLSSSSGNDVGFTIRILHASEISRNMLQTPLPYNLNAMSHDAAIQMIRAVLKEGVSIDTCFVDTVGPPDSYKRKLEREFLGSGIHFVVEKKADSKFAVCSAASVVAKVSRDTILEHWTWSEPGLKVHGKCEFGSGYPSDPKCKAWLEKNRSDAVFGFPDLVRFSWEPARKALEEEDDDAKEKKNMVTVEWPEEEEEEEERGYGKKRQQTKLNSFVIGTQSNSNGSSKQKKPRYEYFHTLGLDIVETL